MRNPNWHRDEIVLALDLYFDTDRGSIDKKNEKIIRLSHLLNQLPLFKNRSDETKFRNPNGVTLKLSNFLAIDPQYHGEGMAGGSSLDKEIFNEFKDQKEKLRHIAHEIKTAASYPNLLFEISETEDDENSFNDAVSEGQVLYKLHKVRERDKSIVLLKKQQAIANHQRLLCEACMFDFEAFYGSIGLGFIECHHKTPLSQFKVEKKTKLEDLALVCANCHRMLHRNINTLAVDELRMIIQNKRESLQAT